jgi:hypothetical protein
MYDHCAEIIFDYEIGKTLEYFMDRLDGKCTVTKEVTPQ